MAEVTLEEAYTAETGKVYQILMGEGQPKGNDLAFTYRALPQGGGEFIFEAVLTKVLIEKLGLDPEDGEGAKKLRKITAFKGLDDLKRRLNGGHDENFDNLPYIKMYSLRDKPEFEAYL